MSLVVRELDELHCAAWDRYVHGAQEATFFHLSGWRQVIHRAFGHSTYFLFVEDEGEIVGVLPLARVRSLLFGDVLQSLPFCVYGGIIANNGAVARLLRDASVKLADELGVDSLELRNCRASDSGWPVKDLYFTFRKTLLDDDDANLMAIPNRQRAMIRKGIGEGLVSGWDQGTRRLYSVYSESVRNLGTPVFSRKYLEILRDVFAEHCSVLMITREGVDVAGVMSFYFRDQVLPYYGGSTSASRDLKGVNHFMYWELMRLSTGQGYRVFDFGRSKSGTGPYSFKKNFGFEPQPLPYEYYLAGSSTLPDVNPMNPKYRAMVAAWRRLPLPVANLIGPLLARSLG